MQKEILVVDDEKDIRGLVKDILEDNNYRVRTAASSEEVFTHISDFVPHLVILDIWLQGSELDGLGILEILHEKYPNTQVIMMSGHGNIQTAVNAIKLGAYDYLEKPFSEEKLLIMVKRALEMGDLIAENAQLKFKIADSHEIIGESNLTNKLRVLIDKLSSSSSRVLLTGESGVGKSLFARMVHANSNRNKNPFFMLDIYNKTSAELEVDLFGEPKTSNIFQLPRKIGALEIASGGTLYIKSIDYLPLETQSLFLKFLQSPNKFHDVRIITSTTKELKQEVANGNFREDLYYRLNVAPVRVPSLHERKQDIALLVNYFIDILHKTAGYKKIVISEATLAAMQLYRWPGNIRQLKNIIEWLMIMHQGSDCPEITPSMLPSEILSSEENNFVADVFSDLASMSIREAREAFESHYLKIQLRIFNGNISKVANAIGMERSALHRKLKGFDLVFSDEKK